MTEIRVLWIIKGYFYLKIRDIFNSGSSRQNMIAPFSIFPRIPLPSNGQSEIDGRRGGRFSTKTIGPTPDVTATPKFRRLCLSKLSIIRPIRAWPRTSTSWARRSGSCAGCEASAVTLRAANPYIHPTRMNANRPSRRTNWTRANRFRAFPLVFPVKITRRIRPASGAARRIPWRKPRALLR